METSPLTQQERPSVFQPKIAQLYDDLWNHDHQALTDTDGFWREFFILRPDTVRLRDRLDRLDAGELLHLQSDSQLLFRQAILATRLGKGPSDENALDTLAVFLSVILSKRFTNPSADVITVIAGLDEVDLVFSDFATTLDACIRSGRTTLVRRKAVDVVLILVSGAYQTSLVSYFTYRDLFAALVKAVQESDDHNASARVLLLLGILANYNKFEFRNPYRIRMEDCTNAAIIRGFVSGYQVELSRLRDQYVAIQDDVFEGWTLSNTLAYIGLGVLAPSKPSKPAVVISNEVARKNFAELPDLQVTVMLGASEFSFANKVFAYDLINLKSEAKAMESPLSTFLSLTSYILHHAYRSSRSTLYGMLALLNLRTIVEDVSFCKTLCDPDNMIMVRLCRQRQPYLPTTAKLRPPMAHILDILVDTINHNLRRQLDMSLYVAILELLLRIISFLATTRTRLAYHWSLLWQTLLSFLRFLTTYASSFAIHDPNLGKMLKPFTSILALCVSSGESFLPDPASYDDLFYKLVETGDILPRFKNAFNSHMNVTQEPGTTPSSELAVAPIDLLIHVSSHYQQLVTEERSKGRLGNNPSPREISKIIRKGYETLSLPAPNEGLGKLEPFRESDEKGLLKRAARLAVEDTKQMMKPS